MPNINIGAHAATYDHVLLVRWNIPKPILSNNTIGCWIMTLHGLDSVTNKILRQVKIPIRTQWLQHYFVTFCNMPLIMRFVKKYRSIGWNQLLVGPRYVIWKPNYKTYQAPLHSCSATWLLPNLCPILEIDFSFVWKKWGGLQINLDNSVHQQWLLLKTEFFKLN